MKKYDLMRMTPWLLMAAIFYALAATAVYFDAATALQTALWKGGHVTVGAFLGYWIDRNAQGRMREDATDGRRIARAVIMLGAIVGIALGL